jgi:putative tryptophan/tyrosine transport system substrate-binding protein
MTIGVGRRQFISALGGVAVAWPLAARAQQAEGMRRIAVLLGWSETPEFRSWIATFAEGLARLGWVDGRNVQMDVRWARGDVRRMQTFAKELVELQPDGILASTTPVTAALQREARTLPIVFVVVVDPVGSGFVGSVAPRWKHHGVR